MLREKYVILMCDDEVGSVRLLEKWFGGMPEFEVVTMTDGLSAQNYLEKNIVDLIITDIRMPFVDGLELIGKVKSIARDCPIIIISGYDDFNYARQAMQYGVKDYFLKPFDLDELHACVLKCCEEIKQRREQWLHSEYYKYEALEVLIAKSIKKGEIHEDCMNELEKLEYRHGTVLNFIPQQDGAGYYKQDEMLNFLRNMLNGMIPNCITLKIQYVGEGFYCLVLTNNEQERQRIQAVEEYINRILTDEMHVKVVNTSESATEFINWALEQELKNANIHIQKALQYMEAHIGEPISRSDVANFVGFSSSYFSRVFQNITGRGYSEYLTDMRIEKAKKMLADNCKVKDVAKQLAFHDARYFSRVFCKKVGYLPSEYQQKVLSEKKV